MEKSTGENLRVASFPTLMDISKGTAGSVTTQEHDTTVKDARRTMLECMGSLLGDPIMVEKLLRSNTEETKKPLAVLEFVHHCVCVLPQCFVAFISIDEKSSFHVKDYNWLDLYHSQPSVFTMWVISRLLHLLSSAGCIVLHQKTQEIVKAIIQLARSKDPHFFQKLMLDFIGLLEDINTIVKNHKMENENPLLEQVVILNRFCNEGLSLDQNAEVKLQVSTMEECHLLQKATSVVIQDTVAGVCQYVAFASDRLWNELIFLMYNCPQETAYICANTLAKLCRLSGFKHRQSIGKLIKRLLEELKGYLLKNSTSPRITHECFWNLWNRLLPDNEGFMGKRFRLQDNFVDWSCDNELQSIVDLVSQTLQKENLVTTATSAQEQICRIGLSCLKVCYRYDVCLKDLMPLIKELYRSYEKLHTISLRTIKEVKPASL